MIELVTAVDAAPAQVCAAMKAVTLPWVISNERPGTLVEHAGDGTTRLTYRLRRDLLGPYLTMHAGRVKGHAESLARVDRAGLALVMHAVAVDMAFGGTEWHQTAPAMLAAGGDWPVIAELAADESLADDGNNLDAAVQKRLVEQLAAEIADRAPLNYWDVVAGVAARACTLGVISLSEFEGVLVTNATDSMDARTVGADLMWEVWCDRSHEYGVLEYDAEKLLVRADVLIPPNSIDGPLAVILAELLHG
ncbi:hypothetical protein [Actinoplanes sp. NPDC020271]|uniref:hypothetical protein n=1 Tax=Actinoplanes sp. NPDC020271 TaxID=3363896 RepID=UPI0037A31518